MKLIGLPNRNGLLKTLTNRFYSISVSVWFLFLIQRTLSRVVLYRWRTCRCCHNQNFFDLHPRNIQYQKKRKLKKKFCSPVRKFCHTLRFASCSFVTKRSIHLSRDFDLSKVNKSSRLWTKRIISLVPTETEASTSHLKQVFRLEENVSRVVDQLH